MPNIDVRIFRQLLVAVTVALSVIILVAICIARIGAPHHLFRSITDACLSLQHVMSDVVSIILAGVVAVTITLGALTLFSIQVSTRRFVKSLKLADSDHHNLPYYVIDDKRLMAFSAGWLVPQIFVSSGAIMALTKDELEAVVAHERHHVKRRDPLKQMFSRTIATSFFWLPVIRELERKLELAAEVCADRSAVFLSGRKTPLARAILRFASCPSGIAVSNIAGTENGQERIRILCGDHDFETRISRKSIVVSTAAVSLIFVLAVAHEFLMVM